MILSLYVSQILVRQVFGERQASISLSSMGNFNFRNLWWLVDGFLSLVGGRPKGRINTNFGFRFRNKGKKTKDGDSVFSSSRITPYSPLRETKSLIEWYLIDRATLKKEAVFAIWERSHTTSDMWQGAGIVNRPHRTLKIDTLE